MAAIHVRFGLSPQLPQELETLIKQADRVAAYLEATQLAGFSISEAEKFFGRPKGLAGNSDQSFHALKPMAPNSAGKAFMARFGKLKHV
jgi:hypothetical protein